MPNVDREPAELRERANEKLALAKLYLCCNMELNSNLPTEHMTRGWVAEGGYRNEDDEVFLERVAVTATQDEETLLWSYEIHRAFPDGGYGADQISEHIGLSGKDIPDVGSIDYRVYVDGEGFHADITGVDFDWDSVDDEMMEGLESFFSEDGLTASIPGPTVRLPRIAEKATVDAHENLLFSLSHLEPIPVTSSAQ
jgi:hypothetical protein